MLDIDKLEVSVAGTPILQGIDLHIKPGEIHAIMGPNGSGKSTLSHTISGRPGYEITGGSIRFEGEDIREWDPEIRAREGIFVAFQYPVEIPGVKNNYFLKACVNAMREHRGESELDAFEFLNLCKEKMKLVEMPSDLMGRSINEGFSGGEKKRNEVLQMLLLEPKLCILDETDSGLDIDALRLVSKGVNSLRSPDRSMLIITHYQRLLDYIVPDVIHVLSDGKIVKSGGKELALELEEKGYSWIDGVADAADDGAAAR